MDPLLDNSKAAHARAHAYLKAQLGEEECRRLMRTDVQLFKALYHDARIDTRQAE